jgi:hypothetical protein
MRETEQDVMPISPLLKRFVDDELTRSAALVERACNGTLAQLRDPRDGMLGAAERQSYFEIVEALTRKAADFQREFVDGLRVLVLADLAEDTSDAGTDALGGLQLMDESRVESDIEISRAAQLIDTTAEWELRELQTFTSTLAGQQHVSAESNPLRPLAYARALWQAVCIVTPVPVQRALLLRTVAGLMAAQLKLAWAAACTRLEMQGVEPGLYKTVILTPGTVRPPTFDVTKPGALENLLSNMPATPGGAAAAAPGALPAGFSANRPAARTRSFTPAFEAALKRVEQSLNDVAPAGIAGQLSTHRSELVAQTTATVDRQIIEFITRLFDAVLSDEELPPHFRALMARLQASVLRIALADATLLASHEHAVWRLMNTIALAAETWGPPPDPRGAALLEFCEPLVDGIARTGVPDAQPYRRGLDRLEAFLSEQQREQLVQATASVDALDAAERREDLEHTLAQRLADQMATVRTSPSIRRFITGTWSRVLAVAMVEHGDQAEPTAGYLKAVDDLLWSLAPPDHPRSRQRMIAMLPVLLQRLRAGMASIGVAVPEQQVLLDELMAVHTEALKPGKSNVGEPTPSEIVQRLREEVTADDADERTPFSDSLIDLGSMETVPAELMASATEEADGQVTGDAPLNLDTLLPDMRARVFLQGRWRRLQLLWRSPRGRYFLFAGEAPGRTHSVALRALERLREEGLVHRLENASLVQRAVDGLMARVSLPG